MPLSSRIANKASNLILVPFGRLAEWLKLSHRLSRHLVSARHTGGGGWEETASTYTSRIAVKAQPGRVRHD
jgi:hypothetical protein